MKRRLIGPAYTMLLVFISVFTSCKTSQVTAESKILEPSGPHILFISYKFNGGDLQLVNKKMASGKFKVKSHNDATKVNGDLILVQLDENKIVLDGLSIPNPRMRIVEYADDNGVFEKKTVKVDNAEFTARVNLNQNTKFVMIKEYNNESTELLILNLTELE